MSEAKPLTNERRHQIERDYALTEESGLYFFIEELLQSERYWRSEANALYGKRYGTHHPMAE